MYNTLAKLFFQKYLKNVFKYIYLKSISILLPMYFTGVYTPETSVKKMQYHLLNYVL